MEIRVISKVEKRYDIVYVETIFKQWFSKYIAWYSQLNTQFFNTLNFKRCFDFLVWHLLLRTSARSISYENIFVVLATWVGVGML